MVTLAEGESVIMTGAATNWHSKRTGQLTLTSRRITFEPSQSVRLEIRPHAVGVDLESHLEFPLSQLVSTRLIPPLFGNVVTLEIVSRRRKGVFEVDNVHEWLRAIRNAQGEPPSVVGTPTPANIRFDTVDAPGTPSVPPCPRCGGTPVREANGMLRCPNCSPSS
ncbi:MAG TPA: hypothetical protein VML94_02735 [Thermoplasmata archaeon]|nr:hypothetical protein [Thermoplasmata archaeon]